MDKKVLLVADDIAMSRAVIAKFLSATYDVIEAENGREVLELLAARPVDAILLDIIMPEMDGLEVLRSLQTRPELKNLGILVATSTKEKTERVALSLGADDIVAKPYDPVVIKKRLENILAAKELNRRLEDRAEGGAGLAAGDELADVRHEAAAISEQLRLYTRLISASQENMAVVSELLSVMDKQLDKLDALTRSDA